MKQLPSSRTVRSVKNDCSIYNINPPEIPKFFHRNLAEVPDLLDVKPEGHYGGKVFEERLLIDKRKEKHADIDEVKNRWSEDEVESFYLGHYEFEQQSIRDWEDKVTFLKKYLPNKTANEIAEYLFMVYLPDKRKDRFAVLPKRATIKRKRKQSSTSNGGNSKCLKKKVKFICLK